MCLRGCDCDLGIQVIVFFFVRERVKCAVTPKYGKNTPTHLSGSSHVAVLNERSAAVIKKRIKKFDGTGVWL